MSCKTRQFAVSWCAFDCLRVKTMYPSFSLRWSGSFFKLKLSCVHMSPVTRNSTHSKIIWSYASLQYLSVRWQVSNVGNGHEIVLHFHHRWRLNLLLQQNFEKRSQEPLEITGIIILWHVIKLKRFFSRSEPIFIVFCPFLTQRTPRLSRPRDGNDTMIRKSAQVAVP